MMLLVVVCSLTQVRLGMQSLEQLRLCDQVQIADSLRLQESSKFSFLCQPYGLFHTTLGWKTFSIY